MCGSELDDPPRCQSCGVCCFSMLERYVRVSGREYARLGEDAETLVRFIGNRAYMRMPDGHCAALRIDRDSAKFVCSVYDRRPDTCRDLERGSPECLGERALKADRPSVALRRGRRGGG